MVPQKQNVYFPKQNLNKTQKQTNNKKIKRSRRRGVRVSFAHL